MVKKSFILSLIIGIVIFNLHTSVSAQTFENEVLRINCNPTSVILSPGARTTVQIIITNICNQTEYVYIEYIFEETFGLTKGELSENYFQLLPNETHEVELQLIASSRWFHSENDNNGLLEVSWGTELNTTSWGSLDRETRDDSTTIPITVTKNMTIPYIILGVVIIILIIIVIFIIRKHKKKKVEISPEPRSEQAGQGPAEDEQIL